ncbi:phosphotransferase family protein [Halobacillus salinus]|uniref:phosphotransferase family protein n=1 Tax=Halobacillus salinus TaxID=192814 RepID=UPI0009A7E9BE|nr:aminoglycoside phosphotransferase family protein [Halobacillus salinus]
MVEGDILTKGNTASIYLANEKVYKIYEERLPNEESYKEARKQKFARSTGLNVPEVLDVTEINGRQALVMEYVQGESFGDLLLEDKMPVYELMKVSVEIQRDIHKRDAEGLDRMDEKLLFQISNAPYLHEKRKTILINRMNNIIGAYQLCHGDFHLFNLIWTKHNPAIIDWVDASAGDPLADVCRSYLLYLQFSKDLAEIYLNIFTQGSGVEVESVLAWMPILAAARLSEHVSSDNKEHLIQLAYE